MKTMIFSVLLCLTANVSFAQEYYWGYRNQVLKSPSNGVSKWESAHLHACLNNGYQDVGGDWSTCYYTKCEDTTNVNKACPQQTCKDLCTANFSI